MKETGYTKLKRAHDEAFEKLGKYMKRAFVAERKVEKLKSLILLTDPSVSSVEMNELTKTQWMEFTKEFPEEG